MYQPVPQQQTLPTMYDLPSEVVGESGLPDQFHALQAQLLSETCDSPQYPRERLLTAMDLNLYYDPRNTNRYKRPDWFMVLDVPCFPRQEQMRLSYVMWQEGVPPFLVIELLSPGTEAEDLGQTVRAADRPPTKWEVYERLVRIPYYGIYDRYQNHFRLFRLEATEYRELELPESRLWFKELELGLDVWQGEYGQFSGRWLRWYDAQGEWIPTREERAENAEQKYQQLLARLQAQGIDVEEV